MALSVTGKGKVGVHVPLAVNVQMSFPPDVVYVPPAVVGFDKIGRASCRERV